MPAYVILDIQVTDPIMYEEYKKLVPAVVELFGGKYLTRGGKCENLEGDWHPTRVIILEFASMEKAKAWLNSPEYAPVLKLRHHASTSKAVVVEGVQK